MAFMQNGCILSFSFKKIVKIIKDASCQILIPVSREPKDKRPKYYEKFFSQINYRIEQEVKASKLIKSICGEPQKAKEYSNALKEQNYSQLSSDKTL